MARPMPIPTRRFLFLEPRHKASLAPIYIALLCLLALGLAGFLAVLTVPASGPTAAPADTGRSFEGSYLPPPATPKPPRSGTWM